MRKKIILTCIIVATLILLLILVAQIKSNKTDSYPPTNEPNMASEQGKTELDFLRAIVAKDLLPFSGIEVAGYENIKISKDSLGQYLELRITPDQKLVNNGIRAEVAVDYPYKEGDRLIYSWKFLVPEDFQSDETQGNRWWIFADWHDQPDLNRGETWDTFEAHSAPIIFGYGKLNGVDKLGFSYGPNQKPIGTVDITKGVWHTVKLDVLWSQQPNGKAIVHFDNKEVFNVEGANMLNGYQHYMKIGQYRHRGISTDNTIFVRDFSINKK